MMHYSYLAAEKHYFLSYDLFMQLFSPSTCHHSTSTPRSYSALSFPCPPYLSTLWMTSKYEVEVLQLFLNWGSMRKLWAESLLPQRQQNNVPAARIELDQEEPTSSTNHSAAKTLLTSAVSLFELCLPVVENMLQRAPSTTQ